jgi:hypothetical protein
MLTKGKGDYSIKKRKEKNSFSYKKTIQENWKAPNTRTKK